MTSRRWSQALGGDALALFQTLYQSRRQISQAGFSCSLLMLVGLGGFGGYFEVFSMRQAANVVRQPLNSLPIPDAAPMPPVELSGFVAVSKKGHPLALPPPQATRPSPRSGLPAQRVLKQVTRTFGPCGEIITAFCKQAIIWHGALRRVRWLGSFWLPILGQNSPLRACCFWISTPETPWK